MMQAPSFYCHFSRLLMALTVSLLAACTKMPNEAPANVTALERPGMLNFLVVGDFGMNGQYEQKTVAAQMARFAKTDFVVTVGDNFYNNGVKSAGDSQWQTSFEDIYTTPALQKDWFATLGNHDYRGKPAAEIAYSQSSPRWKMPARYYSVVKNLPEGGTARFLFIDTTPFVGEYYGDNDYREVIGQDTTAQWQWLEQELANATEDWKIVVGHHPVYSGGINHGDTPEMVARLKPLLEQYGVQLYLSGHDHALQHLQASGMASAVDYVISGGGAKGNDVVATPELRFGRAEPGFLHLALSKDSLFVDFINYKGELAYQFKR